jgi:Na+/H+-dicarboxylate symporter
MTQLTLTHRILIAMAAGIVMGVLFSTFSTVLAPVKPFLVDGLLNVIGRIFLALLQVIVVPLVLCSLVAGMMSLGDLRSLGRLGGKTLGLYMLTTMIAATLGLTVAMLIGPGEGFQLTTDVRFELRETPPIKDVLVGMFPTNPVRALADGQMLQIIVFALLLGIAINLAGDAGRRVGAMFVDLNEVMLKMVGVVIKTAPIGVFALLAQTFAAQGMAVFLPLAGYFFTAALCMALHLVGVYSAIVALAGMSPLRFFKKVRAVMAFAFSTSSSGATIPVTLTTVEKQLGVDRSLASFAIPLGATINMDGTAIMQAVATVFIANVYGVVLSTGDFLTVIFAATLSSLGTAAVPGAGPIMLALVLTQVGLPIEGIGLIIGIDRLVDMLRTTVNVTGDCAVITLVARSEGTLDYDVFNADRPDSPPATSMTSTTRALYSGKACPSLIQHLLNPPLMNQLDTPINNHLGKYSQDRQ